MMLSTQFQNVKKEMRHMQLLLKVRVRLYNKEADEINEHEIFMGDLPLMTETGTFVI